MARVTASNAVDNDGDVLTEEEAIKEARKEGVSPAMSRSVLRLRPFLIAGFGAIILVVVMSIGFILGLKSSSMLIPSTSSNGSGGEVWGPGIDYPPGYFPVPSGGEYVDGYKDGFGAGFEKGLEYLQKYYPYLPYYYDYPYYVSGEGGDVPPAGVDDVPDDDGWIVTGSDEDEYVVPQDRERSGR